MSWNFEQIECLEFQLKEIKEELRGIKDILKKMMNAWIKDWPGQII